MNIFLSKYQNKIDRKGRVSIPSAFRAALSEDKFNGIIVYPSFKNNCIEACSMARLQEIYGIIQKLDPYSEERDAFETIVMGESNQLQFDNEGRVIIPAHLMQQVGITEQAIFVGKGLIFEIWEPVAFDTHLKTAKAVAQSNRFILKNQGNSEVGT
jgi:MraZ protein